MTTPLLENILNQPNALRTVAEYQRGEGRGNLVATAKLLKGKKKIVLSGMGASYFASIPFAYALTAAGFDATAIESGELLYFLTNCLDAGTAVLLISRSGESIEVLKLLPIIRARGATVVGVVNVPGSTLAAASDQAVVVGNPADQMVAIQTYTGTVAVFSLLAAAIGGRLDEHFDELEEGYSVLARWIPECVGASEHWQDFLSGRGPLYLLGRGSATATILEGALLMHETAKLPAVALSAAQFRHGPVEVVDADFRALVIGSERATLPLDVSLAEDLTRMGGQVRWIGPAPEESNLQALMPLPSRVLEQLFPIVEIIPLQLAAYRAAEQRGIRPGDFRWAPLVTSSETGFLTPSR